MFSLDASTINIFIQLTVAMLLGLLMGVERSVAHKTAGMRTYALISMGSALFVIISNLMSVNLVGSGFDPMRMASQIIVGIGFIGGGLIVTHGATVRGLTTAAGLWVAGGIGMAVGFGLYEIAVFVTLMSIIIFTLFWRVEEEIKKVSAGLYPEK